MLGAIIEQSLFRIMYLGIKEIERILINKEFKSDIINYTRYASHIKLERLIVFSIAKISAKLGFKSIIEKEKVDLIINSNKIEVKYHFDFDITKKLRKELNKYKSLSAILKKGENKEISRTWTVSYSTVNDILRKKCDFFIWIVSERDPDSYFKNHSEDEICVGYELKKYGCNKMIKKDVSDVLNEFNKLLKKERKFQAKYIKLEIDKPLKNIFHFFIYKFS